MCMEVVSFQNERVPVLAYFSNLLFYGQLCGSERGEVSMERK